MTVHDQPAAERAAPSADHYRRQLETVATNATLALFIMNEHQQCTFMNRAAEELTGYTLPEVQGRPLHDVIHHTHPDGTPYPLEDCPIDRAFPQNMREQGEEVFIHKDGHFYPVAFTASPIRDGDRTVGTIIEARDITERRRREREEADRARLLAFQAAVGAALTSDGDLAQGLQRCCGAIVEHLDAAFARIWTLDESGQVLVLRASAGMYTHLDGAHGRVPVGMYKIGWIAQTHRPHLTNQVVGDPRVSEQEWAKREGMVAFAGYPLLVKDRLVGVLALFARQPLEQRALDALASVSNSVALAADRARAEEERDRALAEAEAGRTRLRDLLTNAPAVIAVLRGPEHVYELANPRYVELVGNRDPVGQSIRVALPELAGQGFYELLDQVYASGEPFIGNEVAARFDRNGDGQLEQAYFNFVYQPTRGPDGAVDGILVHAVEVTEQVEARHRVERLAEDLTSANRELEAFSYSVSHDLRAPLRAMDGFARILQDEHAAKLPEDGQRYLRLVRENAKQMGQLVDDLLAFSRLGRQELSRRRVDVGDLVRNALDDLRPETEGRNVDVRVGELPAADADPALLRQVYANLLANALKFTRGRDPAVVEIGAQTTNGSTVYFVRDNGVGFDMRYANKLFGVFQRLHRPEEYEGTGVGLATVQRVVHRHGGRVWAEAEPGKGAAFFFTLGGEPHQ